MESSTKRHTTLEPPISEIPNSTSDLGGEEKEDRISNLPESVIGLILQKLPTKYAIATAVLSTKWRYLFSSIPNPSIEIADSKGYLDPDPSSISPSFINFVSHLFNNILPQFSLIQELSLRVEGNYGIERVDELISTAPSCNVRSLRLYIHDVGNGISSLDVLRPFTSRLCSLDLQFRLVNLAPPQSDLFPNLTWINFSGVNFVALNSFESALAACPSLRDLTLCECGFPVEKVVVRISVPSLRNLTIKNCFIDGFELMIDTPVLSFLCYRDRSPDSYPVLNPCFRALDEAEICVWPIKEAHRDSDHQLVCTQSVAKLLVACASVRSLSFVVYGLALIYEFPRVIFSNLTRLDLDVFDVGGWEILAKFLENSPILRVLVFYQMFAVEAECYKRFESCLPYSVPISLSSHLSEIKIKGFEGEKDMVKLVQYFLGTARVLENMKIWFDGSFLSHDEVLDIQKDILKAPMCSTNCQIDFVMVGDD